MLLLSPWQVSFSDKYFIRKLSVYYFLSEYMYITTGTQIFEHRLILVLSPFFFYSKGDNQFFKVSRSHTELSLLSVWWNMLADYIITEKSFSGHRVFLFQFWNLFEDFINQTNKQTNKIQNFGAWILSQCSDPISEVSAKLKWDSYDQPTILTTAVYVR